MSAIRQATARVLLLVVMLTAAGCSVDATVVGADSDTASDSSQTVDVDDFTPDLCDMLTDTVREDLLSDIALVLPGVEAQPPVEGPVSCTQSYVSGEGWIELNFRIDDGPITSDTMFELSANLFTDGIDTTQVVWPDNQVVTVVASASDPSSISTWDASMVGGAALAP